MSDERGLQPRIRRVAAAARARGKTHQAAGLAAAAATNRLVIEERTKTQIRNNDCVLTSVSCVVAVARLVWRPKEHTAPHIEDDRVQKECALQPRLVPLRVHEGGVHGPVQKLLDEQDAVDVLEQDVVDVLHCGSTQKTAVWTKR